ncbi:GNAT family N-acetyltransferase [Gordonia aichiensis]
MREEVASTTSTCSEDVGSAATRSDADRATRQVVVDLVTEPLQAPDVAAVAAATFPLACPPHSAPDDVAAYIRTSLGVQSFADYIASEQSDVLVARTEEGAVVGYSLVHHRPPTAPDVAAVITERASSEISKMYVVSEHHARGRTDPPAHLLMGAAIEAARGRGSVLVWLGVNQENVRAQRFYTKMGFRRAGVKTFDLNGSIEHDFILSRRL